MPKEENDLTIGNDGNKNCSTSFLSGIMEFAKLILFFSHSCSL